jgi:hypothetical protein
MTSAHVSIDPSDVAQPARESEPQLTTTRSGPSGGSALPSCKPGPTNSSSMSEYSAAQEQTPTTMCEGSSVELRLLRKETSRSDRSLPITLVTGRLGGGVWDNGYISAKHHLLAPPISNVGRDGGQPIQPEPHVPSHGCFSASDTRQHPSQHRHWDVVRGYDPSACPTQAPPSQIRRSSGRGQPLFR